MDRVRIWAVGFCVVFFAPLLSAQGICCPGGPTSFGGDPNFKWVPPVRYFVPSELTLAAAVTADVATSFTSPGHEANPLLGRNFGAKDASIVLGWTAALIVGEHFAIKRWPKTRKAFAWINFGAASPHAYAAIHNH